MPKVLNRNLLETKYDPDTFERTFVYPRGIENTVYVGRPSKYGNPYLIGKDGDRDGVIRKYKKYITDNKNLYEECKKELKGKDLVCWCAPKACHADILLEIANGN